eukprot:14885449-Alexandrium_andersonii.AAC.1
MSLMMSTVVRGHGWLVKCAAASSSTARYHQHRAWLELSTCHWPNEPVVKCPRPRSMSGSRACSEP